MIEDLGYDDTETYETFALYLCLDESRYLVDDVESDPRDDDRMRCWHCKGDVTELDAITILNRDYMQVQQDPTDTASMD